MEADGSAAVPERDPPLRPPFLAFRSGGTRTKATKQLLSWVGNAIALHWVGLNDCCWVIADMPWMCSAIVHNTHVPSIPCRAQFAQCLCTTIFFPPSLRMHSTIHKKCTLWPARAFLYLICLRRIRLSGVWIGEAKPTDHVKSNSKRAVPAFLPWPAPL
jgi:hypothetical protein